MEYKRTKPTKRKYVVDEGDFHFVMCSYYHFSCCGLVVPLPSHIRLRSVFPFILCAHSFSPLFPLCSCTIFHELTPMHITIFITLKKKMKKKLSVDGEQNTTTTTPNEERKYFIQLYLIINAHTFFIFNKW